MTRTVMLSASESFEELASWAREVARSLTLMRSAASWITNSYGMGSEPSDHLALHPVADAQLQLLVGEFGILSEKTARA
jgi:hypothetical protein